MEITFVEPPWFRSLQRNREVSQAAQLPYAITFWRHWDFYLIKYDQVEPLFLLHIIQEISMHYSTKQ